MDDPGNIRSLSPEQGKTSEHPEFTPYLHSALVEVGQRRMRCSLCLSEVKEEE